MREFRTEVLINSPLGKTHPLNWRNPYEYPKEILDWNAHIHHHNMMFYILHHLKTILTPNLLMIT